MGTKTLARVDGAGRSMKLEAVPPPEPPIDESWDELAVRLSRELDQLTGMLEHLQARPPAPLRRKRERVLKRWLRGAVEWLEVILELGPPQCEDEAKDWVMELYLFDLERPRAVDDFHALLEEAGEPFGLG